jgi:carbonic anhydrase/acetyltransferase-like protein (isoleucine patch superfamily)
MIRSFIDQAPRIHSSAFISESAEIIGDVEIGEEASVWFGCVVRADVNYIRIGARTNVQDCTVIHVDSEAYPTVLEEEITVGHRVTLHGCYIETGCLIGIGSILLDGVHVGRNSLVAAGSLLTPNTKVLPNSLVMGSPAKVKRSVTDVEIERLSLNWKSYVELSRNYRSEGI